MYSVEAIKVFIVTLQKFFSLLVSLELAVHVLQSAVSVVGVFYEVIVVIGLWCRRACILRCFFSGILPQDVIFGAVKCIRDAALLECLDDASWVKLFPCVIHVQTSSSVGFRMFPDAGSFPLSAVHASITVNLSFSWLVVLIDTVLEPLGVMVVAAGRSNVSGVWSALPVWLKS